MRYCIVLIAFLFLFLPHKKAVTKDINIFNEEEVNQLLEELSNNNALFDEEKEETKGIIIFGEEEKEETKGIIIFNEEEVNQLLEELSNNNALFDEEKEEITTFDNNSVSNLPSCKGSYNHNTWTNCFGTYNYTNGNKYVGEFDDYGFEKQGTMYFANGDKYAGEWGDYGKKSGQGTMYFADGKIKEGIWKLNFFQYAKKIEPKTQINIPDNAYASGDTWKCKSGYEKAGNTCKAKVTSEELIAAQKKAAELEQQLAKLQAEKQKKQQQINTDNQIPLIDILSSMSSGKQGVVKGRATDNVEVAEVTINGITIPIDSNGYFEHKTYIREGGTTLTIEAFDMAGLSSSVNVHPLKRNTVAESNAITFDSLNPLGKTVSKNNDALALIIGVSDYENIDARAVYADSDAKIFSDYASDILGIPNNRIKTLVNDGADEKDVLLSVKNWLRRSMKPNQSDVYLFFAGHGLASSDGEDMYLLPYDGSPELLDKTAILRKELFQDITSAKPSFRHCLS